MDRALITLCALIINALFAGPAPFYAAIGLDNIYHLPAGLIRDAERRLNREHRSPSEREMRGFLLMLVVVFGSLILGWLCRVALHQPLPFIELLIVSIALPLRPTWDCASWIQKSLRADNPAAAREALEGTPWRHNAVLDEHGLARAGIEILAVHFSEKIAAPVLWYLLFGLPGLFASKAVYLLQETLTRPGEREKEFGKAARQAHFILHYIPARICAALWLVGAVFTPGLKWRDAAQKLSPLLTTGSPQAVSLLAAGTVLNLSLGGPSSVYSGGEWIGSGNPKPLPADMRRALALFAFLCVLLFILIGVFL